MYVIAVGSISIVCAYLLQLIKQSVYMVCCGETNWENFKKKAKKDLNISSCPDISFKTWERCWKNGVEKKSEKEEYEEFAEDMKQLLAWLRSKIKKNRKMNFRWKRIYIVSFAALGILYLFFFLSGGSEGEGVLSGIGDNWAIFLTFPVLSLAVAKWLAADCDVYIFDEPTKGVDVGAKQEIFTLINNIAKEGNCVIYATCENSELLSITDRMYVMFDGRITAELETAKTSEDEIMHYATGATTVYTG